MRFPVHWIRLRTYVMRAIRKISAWNTILGTIAPCRFWLAHVKHIFLTRNMTEWMRRKWKERITLASKWLSLRLWLAGFLIRKNIPGRKYNFVDYFFVHRISGRLQAVRNALLNVIKNFVCVHFSQRHSRCPLPLPKMRALTIAPWVGIYKA